MQLREHQQKLDADIVNAWNQGARFVLGVLPTGGGKTFIFSHRIKQTSAMSCAIAHRKELVSQISLSLAMMGVRHNIIAPTNVIRLITGFHVEKFGRSFYDKYAMASVAGVDTLVSRQKDLKGWAEKIRMWVIDEAHHVLRDNKWGIGARMFPNAIGLGVTATPERADGRGLGAHADGVFETMVQGPNMRELINRGYLCDYRIIAPPSDMVMNPEDISKATGDYKPTALRKASRSSHIVGDIVEHYMKYAAGKQGITFVTDVEIAGVVAQQYTTAGIRAEAVSATTPEAIRNDLIEQFRRGDLKQLVNVDLFGEGFDVPACEVISMARPTESFGLFAQQFGRGLRTSEGKTHGIILDHVKNVERHGLPDAPRVWTLDRRDKKARRQRDEDVMPVTACEKCFQAYEAIHPTCPYCGYKPVPVARSRPEHVHGDLTEYTPEMLAVMRGEMVDTSPDAFCPVPEGVSPFVAAGIHRKFADKQKAQRDLRDAISWWRGVRLQNGESEQQSYRRFFHTFGVDVIGAQALGRQDAEKLTQKIWSKMG
jgi:DNA repair protein RadD